MTLDFLILIYGLAFLCLFKTCVISAVYFFFFLFCCFLFFFFFFQAEDGIRDADVTGVQTCALPIYGRFGPYVKFGDQFVSLPKGVDPLSVELEDAIVLIKEKQKADAPIYMYKDLPVQKGKGRFGPYIKWNNMYINVNKKYDWEDRKSVV